MRWDLHAIATLAPTVNTMNTQAERDLRGEGFDPAKASFCWEADFGTTEAEVSTVRIESHAAEGTAVLGALAAAVDRSGQVDRPILALRLSTRFAVGTHGVDRRSGRVTSQPPARRDVRFIAGTRQAVDIHRWEAMNVGDAIDGPAVVNGSTLTCPVPAGWRLSVDDYGNARLQRS
jgi:N-methylhydantoinase A/oxoprolinase/acetone carboxylase beta subunit